LAVPLLFFQQSCLPQTYKTVIPNNIPVFQQQQQGRAFRCYSSAAARERQPPPLRFVRPLIGPPLAGYPLQSLTESLFAHNYQQKSRAKLPDFSKKTN